MGIAYQLNTKTVIRASSGIYYARGINSGNPTTYGFSNTPSFSSGDGFTPLYNLGTGTFPAVLSLPSLDPSFRNGQSLNYVPASGNRLPQTLSWTFSIQREVARNLSVEATYLGSHSTHTSFGTDPNVVPLSALPLGNTLLQPINSTAAAAAGINSPFPAFVSQIGANTVYQALKPYPQYTDISMSDPVGQSKFNSLQTKLNKRFSNGLSLLGFFIWSKNFSRSQGQDPNSRRWQMDGSPATVLSFSWAYDLPFGKNKSLLNTDSKVLNAIVSGWKINGFVRYTDGSALSITGASGNLGTIGYGQWPSAVLGVSPYGPNTNPREFDPATGRYLNPAAFAITTGFNFGNFAPSPGWIRGFSGKSESLTRRPGV